MLRIIPPFLAARGLLSLNVSFFKPLSSLRPKSVASGVSHVAAFFIKKSYSAVIGVVYFLGTEAEIVEQQDTLRKMPDKPTKQDSKKDDAAELETQFIMRMPREPAALLREAIQSGANNLKDRLSIRLDNDLRYGEVRFDHWLLHAKVVDLPTIIESLKTIDSKNFYKTADICQMMICKEEPDQHSAEEESPNKNKKKDPNKVDKKYLWPHGVTPPCKNVRKRRFRKTLKKKYVEAPEIEKEVKRLLRVDNEAVNVKWELITEEEDPNKPSLESGADSGAPHKSPSKNTKKSSLNKDVGEHDIFGGEVSDSDEEDNVINKNIDIDESSRLSAEADDSRLSDSSSYQGGQGDRTNASAPATEFNKSMFSGGASGSGGPSYRSARRPEPAGSSKSGSFFPGESSRPDSDNDSNDMPSSGFGNGQNSNANSASTATVINNSARIYELQRQLNELNTQRIQKEQEIRTIENQTLRHRLQDKLDSVLLEIEAKENEMHELQAAEKYSLE
ncbi:transcription initiation factor TFIID subunit 7-like [Anopheles albimanus]|uniref:transcription initiation factor TFIID subunit 7-like n=1 Tax=Anopheles albimanus TaxID=7167 RepID=UPI00163EA9DE|nr:transcription initiation factor TFIID subunit 7-like [Anopheles albimanus]